MIKFYYGIMKKQFKLLVLYYLVNISTYILQPFQLYLTKEMTQAIKSLNMTYIIIFAVFFSSITTIKSIQTSILSIIKKKINFNITQDLYTKLYHDISETNILNFNNAEFNTQVEQAQIAIEQKISSLIYSVSDIVGVLVSLLGMAIIITKINILYLFILILMTLLQNVFVYKNTVETVKLLQTQNFIQRKHDYFMELLQERSNAKEIRTYSLYNWIEEKRRNIFKTMEELDCSFSRKWSIINIVWAVILFACEGMIYLLLLHQYMNKSITLENIIVIIESITLFISNVVQLLDLFATFPKNNLYVSSLYSIQKDKKKILLETKLEKNLVYDIKHVYFSYGKKYVLKNISFSLYKGEILAIVGNNGCGKSTLVNVLLGLYTPQCGQVRVALKNRRTVVYQDFSQFLFSIRENIAFGNIEKINSDEKIWALLDNVELKDKVEKYSQKLNTMIGADLYPDGKDFSGGEWQRIAIARAEFKDAEVIIFDEPTSFMDAIKEKQMFEMLKKIFQNKSVILITHRIGLLGLCDRILFMKDGTIVEQGSHKELIRKKKKYYEFYKNQAKWYK